MPNLCCDTFSPFSLFSWMSPLYSSWSGLMQRSGRMTTPLKVPSTTLGCTMVPRTESFVKIVNFWRFNSTHLEATSEHSQLECSSRQWCRFATWLMSIRLPGPIPSGSCCRWSCWSGRRLPDHVRVSRWSQSFPESWWIVKVVKQPTQIFYLQHGDESLMHLKFLGFVLLGTVDGSVQVGHVDVRVGNQRGAPVQQRIGDGSVHNCWSLDRLR